MSAQRMRTYLAALLSVVLVVTTVGCQQPNAFLRKQGRDALERNDLAVAEQRLTLATRQDATDWKAQWLLGQVLLRQERFTDAQHAFEYALPLCPDKLIKPQIIDGLAEALFQQSQHEAVAAVCQQAADEYASTHDYLRQADYLARIGDVDEASVAFRKAAHFAARNDETPYVRMADFYESIGDSARAIRALRQAYGIKPDDPRIRNRLRGYGYVPDPTIALEPERF